MDNLFAFVVSLASIFIILTTVSGWTLSINAQNDSSRNNSSSGPNTTSKSNGTSIITPWNTGIDRSFDR